MLRGVTLVCLGAPHALCLGAPRCALMLVAIVSFSLLFFAFSISIPFLFCPCDVVFFFFFCCHFVMFLYIKQWFNRFDTISFPGYIGKPVLEIVIAIGDLGLLFFRLLP